MNIENKISFERSAYKKAGKILLHLLTKTKINDNILSDTLEPEILIQVNSNSLKLNHDKSNNDIIMCLRAGPLSEKYYCWLKCINFDSEISGDDLWQISRLFYEQNRESPNFEKHIKSLEEETERLIRMHWKFINIVARQILANKDLKVEENTDQWKELLFKKNS